MRKATRISLALGTSAALLSLSALPASADEVVSSDGGHEATVTVQSNGIHIEAAAPEEVNFKFGAVGEGSARIVIPSVTVTDLRAAQLGWAASVSLENFAAGDLIISTEGAEYNATLGENIKAGEPTAGLTTFMSKGTVNEAAGAVVTSEEGNKQLTWDAVVDVVVPAKAIAGKYTAILTHSVA